jgi:hypothetical protein
VGCGDKGDMAVPAGEGAALEVGEAEAGFEFAVVVFDAPAHFGESDEGFQRCVGGQVRDPVRVSPHTAASSIISSARDHLVRCRTVSGIFARLRRA